MLGGRSNKSESLFSPQAHLTAKVNGAKQSSQHFPTATRGLNQDCTTLRGSSFPFPSFSSYCRKLGEEEELKSVWFCDSSLQAGASEWERYKFMTDVHPFPALIINAQTPPASSGEDERQKTVRNALRLRGMLCRYKVCSFGYRPKTFKKNEILPSFISMSWNLSCLAVTALHVPIRTERSHQSPEVFIWLRYHWALWNTLGLQFMHHLTRVHAAFHPKWLLRVDKPRNCFLPGKVFYSTMGVQQIGNYNSL